MERVKPDQCLIMAQPGFVFLEKDLTADTGSSSFQRGVNVLFVIAFQSDPLWESFSGGPDGTFCTDVFPDTRHCGAELGSHAGAVGHLRVDGKNTPLIVHDGKFHSQMTGAADIFKKIRRHINECVSVQKVSKCFVERLFPEYLPLVPGFQKLCRTLLHLDLAPFFSGESPEKGFNKFSGKPRDQIVKSPIRQHIDLIFRNIHGYAVVVGTGIKDIVELERSVPEIEPVREMLRNKFLILLLHDLLFPGSKRVGVIDTEFFQSLERVDLRRQDTEKMFCSCLRIIDGIRAAHLDFKIFQILFGVVEFPNPGAEIDFSGKQSFPDKYFPGFCRIVPGIVHFACGVDHQAVAQNFFPCTDKAAVCIVCRLIVISDAEMGSDLFQQLRFYFRIDPGENFGGFHNGKTHDPFGRRFFS